MKLQSTNHSYYCSENNYFVGNHNGENYGRNEYDTWNEFKNEWLEDDCTIDCDYNLCFRYDIINKHDDELDEDIKGEYVLWLFFILQRKGIYRPILIKDFKESDIQELEKFLKCQWEYMKNQWVEIEKGGS